MGLLRKYDQSISDYNQTIHTRVLQDISNILNTRKGFGSFDPDFGIEDISHYTDKAMIGAFIKGEIERNLIRYYPQIELIKIIDAPSSVLSRIQLIIELRIRGEALKIHVFNDQGLERWIVSP